MDEFFSNIENPSNKWKVVRSTNNLGYGGGIVFASGFVEKEFVVWMPGNMKIDPLDAFNFANSLDLNSHNTYIKAKRVGRPLIDSLKTKLFGIISSIYFNTYIYDAGGTPNIVHKSFFKLHELMPNDFSFDVFVYYYYKLNNLEIIRPKINYTTRLHGTSHWQKGLMSEVRLLISIFKYKKEWRLATKNKFF